MGIFRIPSFLLFLFATVFIAKGQPLKLGVPPISNFSSKDYKAATQNWDIEQDQKGIIYVANNRGMLEFDGFNWRLHPNGNNTIVRSLAISSNGKIYAGGQGDFGYYYPDDWGLLRYQSLAQSLSPEDAIFGEVWDVIARPEGIFFRTDKKIFFLKQDHLQVFNFKEPLRFVGTLLQQLIIQKIEGTFLIFENGEFRPVSKNWTVGNGTIAALDYHPDTSLVVTTQEGIFYFTEKESGRWETPTDQILMDSRLYCATMLSNGMIALGSTNNGLFLFDRNRQVHQHLNKGDGLQNNTVLTIFSDWKDDLWLGLDNGIDYIKSSSPFTTIFPDGKLEGTGYAIEFFEGKIFFGTNTGLYSIPLKTQYTPEEKKAFQLVPGTQGQVWSLQVLEGELLIGHHQGAFSLHQGNLRKLTNFLGVWRFLHMGKGRAIAGSYEGLSLFEKREGKWTFIKMYSGLPESCRLLAPTEDGGLWVAHPYRGIYKVNFSKSDEIEVRFFGEESGLPSNLDNYVFDLNQFAVVSGQKGVFEFDMETDRFIPAQKFDRIFGNNLHLNYLRQDNRNNIWFVVEDEVGLLLIEDKAIEKKIHRLDFPELSGRPMKGFEFIFPMNDKNIILGTEKGFEHFNLNSFANNKQPFNIILHELVLEADNDSLLFAGHQIAGKERPLTELKHKQNNLRITFGATDHYGKEFIQFAFRIDDDSKWSEWTRNNQVTLYSLRPGEYIFQVKAKRQDGKESEVISFPFHISPPWYTSLWAKVGYWIFLFSVFLVFISRQRKAFERERKEMISTHRRDQKEKEQKVKQSEAIIDQLEREKLETAVRFKNQELASTTMNLVQKDQFLSSIRITLEKLKEKEGVQDEIKKEIQGIIRLIENDANLQEDWKQFTYHFDQVHSDFLHRLGERFPNLSPNDFKLSAYLRMNLSSKEIATLMNISIRGVEASRYRLRKRLGLKRDDNLAEFLIRL